LGGSIHTINKNPEALVVTSNEIGQEVNAERAKYMVMSQDQHPGQKSEHKDGNNSIERVKQFKYLGRTLTNKNSIHEKIKHRLKSWNACYHSVQNLLSSSLLSKNTKIRIYRTVIVPPVLYGYHNEGRM
jgi:hypothetical protein